MCLTLLENSKIEIRERLQMCCLCRFVNLLEDPGKVVANERAQQALRSEANDQSALQFS